MATASSLTGGGYKNAYDAVAASQTDSVLVAGVTGRKIRVLSFLLNQGDTTPSAVTFNSKGSGAGTAVFAALKAAANAELDASAPGGWFETNAGEALTVTTGAGSTTTVAVIYTLVAP